MTVTVVNMYSRVDKKDIDFICDRTSPVGNPSKMNSNSTRDDVCEDYIDYFYHNLNPDLSPPGFLKYLDKILQAAKQRDIILGCWCAPRRCHCDTIKQYVERELLKYTDPPS